MSQDNVIVGRLGRAFGVKGWQHLQSFTSPSENLLSYQPWFLRGQNSDRWQAIEDYEIQNHNDGYLVGLLGSISAKLLSNAVAVCSVFQQPFWQIPQRMNSIGIS